MEQQQRNGAERDDLITSVLNWVEEKGSAAAFAVVAEMFSTDATRAEFARLQEIAAHIDGCEDSVEEALFNVFSRTLE